MAWADYYLPAKSVRYDTPISGDIRFYAIRWEQLNGLRLGLNERLLILGQSAISESTITNYNWGGLDITSSRPPLIAFNKFFGGAPDTSKPQQINLYRSEIDRIFSSLSFDNGNVLNPHLFQGFSDVLSYPSSNIEELVCYETDFSGGGINPPPTYLPWTKATMFGYASIGNGSEWTTVPSPNPFGLSELFSSRLTIPYTSPIPAFKQHPNEIRLAIQGLKYGLRIPTRVRNSTTSEITFTLDLSAITVGSAKFYAALRPFGAGQPPEAGLGSPAVTVDGKYHFLENVTVGSSWTSGVVATASVTHQTRCSGQLVITTSTDFQ